MGNELCISITGAVTIYVNSAKPVKPSVIKSRETFECKKDLLETRKLIEPSGVPGHSNTVEN